jgi:hypothetical protein
MFLVTVRWGNNADSCGTNPTLRFSGGIEMEVDETSRPFIVIEPESTESNPAISRNSVVLPPPDAPRIVSKDPSETENETSLKTDASPKDLATFSNFSFSVTTYPLK